MSDLNHEAQDRQPFDHHDDQAATAEPTQRSDRTRTPAPEQIPARNTRRTNKSLALLTSGLSLYLIVLWFGVTVVGDTVLRSALMAALIVTIAGTGFVHSRRSVSPEE